MKVESVPILTARGRKSSASGFPLIPGCDKISWRDQPERASVRFLLEKHVQTGAIALRLIELDDSSPERKKHGLPPQAAAFENCRGHPRQCVSDRCGFDAPAGATANDRHGQTE